MKNIMLLFLSPFPYKPDSHDYKICHGKTVKSTHTNEAPLADIAEYLQGKTLDKIFYIASYKISSQETDKRFKEMLQDKYSPELFQAVPFDERATELIEESMNCVTRMINGIDKYLAADNTRPEDVRLYIDLTGGLRTSSLILANTLQLLQYRGMKLERAVYSVRDDELQLYEVHDVAPVNNLYKLINGADEFVKYGSANAIDEYFSLVPQKKKSESLLTLLDAMRDFSAAMRFCIPDAIIRLIPELSTAIDSFRAKHSNTYEELMFTQLIDQIEQDYSRFKGLSELDMYPVLIKWAVGKKLLQQAVTFGVELLPRYICQKHILEPSDEKDKAAAARDSLHGGHWENTFIYTYNLPSPAIPASNKPAIAEDKYYEAFLSQIKGIEAEMAARSNIRQEIIEKYLCEIKNADEILEKARLEIENQLQSTEKQDNSTDPLLIYPVAANREHPLFFRLLKFIYMWQDSTIGSFEKFLYKHATREIIAKNLLDFRKEPCSFPDELAVLLKILQTNKESQKNAPKPANSPKGKWQQRKAYWEKLLPTDKIKTNYPDKKAEIIGFLEKLNALRVYRNSLDHALSERRTEGLAEAEAQAINLVEECLAALKLFCGPDETFQKNPMLSLSYFH